MRKKDKSGSPTESSDTPMAMRSAAAPVSRYQLSVHRTLRTVSHSFSARPVCRRFAARLRLWINGWRRLLGDGTRHRKRCWRVDLYVRFRRSLLFSHRHLAMLHGASLVALALLGRAAGQFVSARDLSTLLDSTEAQCTDECRVHVRL